MKNYANYYRPTNQPNRPSDMRGRKEITLPITSYDGL